MTRPRLLYVEPDRLNRQAIERVIGAIGWDLVCVNDELGAVLALLCVDRPSAVITTWRRVDAVEVIAAARTAGLPVRIYSGWPIEERFAELWIAKTRPDALTAWLRGLATEVPGAHADRR